jgi:high frequency lysogenization protein
MTKTDQKLQNTVIALAGIFQAASLVRDLAKNGTADEAAFQASINSIYKIDATSVTAVYGSVSDLRLGLIEIIRLLGNERSAPEQSFSRYVISILHLERKLMSNKSVLDTLARRIKHAISQVNYFSITHPTVLRSLADIYINTLGTFPFRIQILGQAKFLNQEEVIFKIRALLLAGVRSAVLWRQIGGRRWQLFLLRSKIAKIAKQLLEKN